MVQESRTLRCSDTTENIISDMENKIRLAKFILFNEKNNR